MTEPATETEQVDPDPPDAPPEGGPPAGDPGDPHPVEEVPEWR